MENAAGNGETGLVDAAAALTPLVREHAGEASLSGTLPLPLVEALEAAGLFRVALPRELGGLEADAVTIIRVGETLAHADGSTAWAVLTGNSAMFLAWLDPAVAAQLVGERAAAPWASSFAPSAQGVEVPGGFRVSGRYSYVSGSPHAEGFIGAFVIAGADGPRLLPGGRPAMRWGVLPVGETEVTRSWEDAAGLRGSGSHDVVVKDVFVPAEHTMLPPAEPPKVAGTYYRLPFYTVVRILLAGVPLGIARRALDELATLSRHKVREMRLVAEDPDVQIRVARAEAALRAARTYLFEATRAVWAAGEAGAEVPREARLDFTLAAQAVMESAVGAVDLAFEVAGASAALRDDVIQRCWRDVHVARLHVAFSRARWTGAGQALLGVDIEDAAI
ncbi:acyl-CoA dehydrogenase family protein [Amycolatopsis rhabdoformis]|uniref:Acyl-CoA dehydrogenase family protein n=1 Tax=Amycolatopsis rhabdoformis TaxID=1448059 RepID=A0ABZ1I786_9PSEU|nr:acyl-CoA dehydrogenase family protein [Amycolatopsis rhabdoformis]WSE30225.1 acyl-CoA dehydrogenase family protein [Amycolatopsis rhabdoformis]